MTKDEQLHRARATNRALRHRLRMLAADIRCLDRNYVLLTRTYPQCGPQTVLGAMAARAEKDARKR